MPTTQPKYDVAISFLSKDGPTAAALHDRLSEGLEVFFYPRKQEELAGTNGMESMRTPFLEDSRVVVVFYREPWGNTPWTRVEQDAIQDGCLRQGWKRLFFVMLDNASTPPIWLPQHHVRFNYADFGLEQAVGAIKARVQESGGAVMPLTPLKRAALYEQESLYMEDKKQISSHHGMGMVRQKVEELFAEIKRLCAEIEANGNAFIRVGSNTEQCVITNFRVSLIVSWRQPLANSTNGCALKVLEYSARMAFPGEHLILFGSEPTKLRETNFSPELSHAREYGWTEKGELSQFATSAVLASQCVIQFLDLAAKAERGDVQH